MHNNRDSSDPIQHLNGADDLRLRSWALDVVKVLLPESGVRLDLADVQFDGGLRVQRTTGVWYHHAHGRGGHSLVPLIQLLKNCSRAEAVQWARAWLAAHDGFGSCNGAEPDDDADDDGRSAAATEAGMERAREYQAQLVPIVGTPGEVYLRKR